MRSWKRSMRSEPWSSAFYSSKDPSLDSRWEPSSVGNECACCSCAWKKNTPNNYTCIFSPSLFCRTHETLFLCVAHIYWCLVLLCAPVSLLLSTFARLQNEVVISKTHIVKIWTCPYCPFLLTASHQGVPGPGQYDIRRQCEPHGSRCSFLSQAEVCKCTAHSFLSPATNEVSKSGMVWLHFHFSVCVKILCPVFVKELEKICSLAESCSTDVERIISTHMTS